MDQAVHEKRLEFYPLLVKAAPRLALYFAGDDPSGKASVGPDECRAMGRAMLERYFGGGGLLLSVKARDADFKLARALTRASLAKALKVPTFPDDAEDISIETVRCYQDQLMQNLDLDDVENGAFGSPASEKEAADHGPQLEFKDYEFL